MFESELGQKGHWLTLQKLAKTPQPLLEGEIKPLRIEVRVTWRHVCKRA